MKRKKFIKTCSIGCLGLTTIGPLMQGCTSAKMITSPIEGYHLIVPLSEFEIVKNETKSYYPYIIAQNPKLKYPIAIYRFNENDFSVMLMRCTHQGTELQAFGNKLQCPAHGSEFGNRGDVSNGPASESLRSFSFTLTEEHLKISLT